MGYTAECIINKTLSGRPGMIPIVAGFHFTQAVPTGGKLPGIAAMEILRTLLLSYCR